MPRLSLVLIAFGLLLMGLIVQFTPAEDRQTPKTPLTPRFTVPEGFVIERVAGSPLVDRPITAAFDEQGRLYVADSSGTNDKVAIQLEQKPHRIVRLEDTNGDGVFDKSVVFADRMMFPEGTLWYAGSLYVAAPPSIWKLTDTNGDGVADQRVEWFEGKTLTGCANDLHGPYLGPDGWIYWCKGAFAKQTHERPGKAPFETRASHIFRARPDGSGVEPVMTGGMDNPVDVVFTPGGERIFTTTFLQHPAGGKRDGLIHAVYGGVYGKDHDPVYEHPWTSPELMPPLTHLGPAAPCGLLRAESDAFGPDYRNNIYACLFNLHKVTRHVLTPTGATFTTKDEDFVVSDSLDFHPTDVIEDADGSLLVIDTGGWYKLCCPTSQLVKPDILGGIYRVRRKDAPKLDDPRGLRINWAKADVEQLASLLGDPRPAVRQRAIETIATRPNAVLSLEQVVREGKSAESRRNAVWALNRIDAADARAAVRLALGDEDDTIRQVALHSISVRVDRDAVAELIKRLPTLSAANRRAAAEALGRIGNASAVPALLAALGESNDRFLEHSLTFALIEIADAQATAVGLKSANPGTRRAALIALDQMPGGKLDSALVAGELESSDAALKEAAWWIVGRHPEWGAELAGFVRTRLGSGKLSDGERQELIQLLARLARTSAVQQLLRDSLNDSTPTEVCRVALGAIARSGLRQTPEGWTEALTDVLASRRSELHSDALNAVRALPTPKQSSEKLMDVLLRIGNDDKATPEVRLAALASVVGGLKEMSPALFDFVRLSLDHEQPVGRRAFAAEVVARARLSTPQLLVLAETLKTVGPMEIHLVLEAFGQSGEEAVGGRLLAALRESPALSSVRIDALRQRLAKYGPAVKREAENLYAQLNAELGKQTAKLEELHASLGAGDIRRGQILFNSNKLACSACHAIGYLGGKVGPDLTRIGQIRNERDLLESIAFPSASFVQGYEPVVVTTKRGKTYNGLLRKNAADEIVLALNATEEVRIVRDDIEELLPSKVSVMPAGLDQQLTRSELADLVAFLRACR